MLKKVLSYFALFALCASVVAGNANASDHSGGLSSFIPFFLSGNDVEDLQPAHPTLSDFDNAVLDLCGEWGSTVDKNDFIAFAKDQKYAQEFAEMYQLVQGDLGFGKMSKDKFADRMADVLFDRNVFPHVFCGEPTKKSLGGLHYVGRYAQMSGKHIGINTTNEGNCSKSGADEGIHYFSMDYVDPAKQVVKNKCLNGYHYHMDAKALLANMLLAYKDAFHYVEGSLNSSAKDHQHTDKGHHGGHHSKKKKKKRFSFGGGGKYLSCFHLTINQDTGASHYDKLVISKDKRFITYYPVSKAHATCEGKPAADGPSSCLCNKYSS